MIDSLASRIDGSSSDRIRIICSVGLLDVRSYGGSSGKSRI